MTVRIRLSSLKKAAERRPPGYQQDVLDSAERNDGTFVHLTQEAYDALSAKYANAKPAPQQPVAWTHPGGPGTELKKLLKDWLGIVASPNCSCNARARTMDEWGPDVCEQRIPEIVGWLEEQARGRNLPFVRFAAEQAVKMAIRRARKKAAKPA
jgi:hypothetical protein